MLGNQDHRTQVWAWGGPEPQASKGAPRSSSFNAGEEGGGLDPHLGPGWARELAGREREGTGFHFPGQMSEAGLGRVRPKGLRPGSHFLFPTVQSYVTPTHLDPHPPHPWCVPGQPWLRAQGAPRDPRRDSRGERSPWLPLKTRSDSPGEPGMQPRDACFPWRSMDCIVHGVAKSWTRLSN